MKNRVCSGMPRRRIADSFSSTDRQTVSYDGVAYRVDATSPSLSPLHLCTKRKTEKKIVLQGDASLPTSLPPSLSPSFSLFPPFLTNLEPRRDRKGERERGREGVIFSSQTSRDISWALSWLPSWVPRAQGKHHWCISLFLSPSLLWHSYSLDF